MDDVDDVAGAHMHDGGACREASFGSSLRTPLAHSTRAGAGTGTGARRSSDSYGSTRGSDTGKFSAVLGLKKKPKKTPAECSDGGDAGGGADGEADVNRPLLS